MREKLISIGEIVGTHGNKGEVKTYSLTDFPERFEKIKNVYLEKEGERKDVKIEYVRLHKGKFILKLLGYNSLESSAQLKGAFLKIKREEAVDLPENSYFIHDIIGLDVFTIKREYLGKIKDVFHTGSNDVYTIEKSKKEFLIPATKEIVKEINLRKKEIIINLLEGLR